MENRILILLSTYNGEKYIEEQLLSLINQKNVEVTILIRDDGSIDSTVSIIKKIQNEHDNIILVDGVNIGCAKSFSELLLNAARMFADYNYFAFCDQDDFWLPEKLDKAVSILNKHDQKKQLLYCSNLWVVDKYLNNKTKKYPNNYVRIDKAMSLTESYGTGCTMVFNKAVVDFYCAHQPTILHLHDLWIYHQCLFLGEVFYDDESYILYRQHENNVVGAKTGRFVKINSLILTLRKIDKQHYREVEANEILKTYGNYLSQKDKSNLSIVAGYRKSFIKFCKLLFSRNIKRRKNLDNLLFKLRIIFRLV